MTPTMRPPAGPGFWWSPVDPVVVLATAVATWMLTARLGAFAGVLPLIVGHYLLFCNVVRLRFWRELLWAAAMVWSGAVVMVVCQTTHWLPIALAVAPTTLILVLHEVREPTYRGVGAEWRVLRSIRTRLTGTPDQADTSTRATSPAMRE
jgi:hypothetical protein